MKILLDEAYENEEKYWNGTSRVNWLKERDKNTKYFHALIAEKMKRNRIEIPKG